MRIIVAGAWEEHRKERWREGGVCSQRRSCTEEYLLVLNSTMGNYGWQLVELFKIANRRFQIPHDFIKVTHCSQRICLITLCLFKVYSWSNNHHFSMTVLLLEYPSQYCKANASVMASQMSSGWFSKNWTQVRESCLSMFRGRVFCYFNSQLMESQG